MTLFKHPDQQLPAEMSFGWKLAAGSFVFPNFNVRLRTLAIYTSGIPQPTPATQENVWACLISCRMS